MLSCRVVLILLLLTPPFAAAQEIRYELGQRLRQFERELDRPEAAKQRKRALKPLEEATPAFFAGQLSKAASLLDQSRLLLSAAEPESERVWASSHVFRPVGRFHDSKIKELPVKVETLYKTTVERPAKVTMRLSLLTEAGKVASTRTTPTDKLPATINLPLKAIAEGDYQLRCEVLVDDKSQFTSEQTISFAAKLNDRLAALKKGIDDSADIKRTTEKLTLPALFSTLSELSTGKTLETNFPAAALLSQAEAVLQALKGGKTYYGKDRPGGFWLQLAGEGGGDAVRVQIPAAISKGPVPVVVAMHGAGGSENMFYDAYGDGLVAKLCAKRGWALVTTRSPLFSFGGGPDVLRVIDALAKIYPIDTKKVFLVGHSMGAAQSVALAARNPERFAAVAALGGGGGIRPRDAIKDLPFFIGVGDRDFALRGAQSLHASLQKAGVKKAVFKKYESVEHIIIAQLALPEVFDFFAAAIAPKP